MQTHIQCYYSPCVQSLVSVYEPMLKFWSIGSHTIVWTHESAAYTRSALEDGVWLPNCSGRAIETCHKHNLFPPKKAQYLGEKRSAEEVVSVQVLLVGWVGKRWFGTCWLVLWLLGSLCGGWIRGVAN